MVEFMNPAFLWALLAAAAPVAVHLVFRRKAVQVDWSSVSFLRLIDVRLARNRRLREILVLAVRTGMLALCALALARPVWRPSAGAAPGGSTAMVVVVDSSASMRMTRGGRSAFDSAVSAAREALSTLGKGDEAAVLFPGSANPGGPALSRFADEARARLDSAACGYGRGQLGPAIAEAAAALAESVSPNREIVVLTDLRRSAIEGVAAPAAPQAGPSAAARVFVVRAAPEAGGNVSVSDARILNPPAIVGSPVELQATVRNHGESGESGSAFVSIGSQRHGEKEYSLDKGQAADLAFRHTFEKAGEHRVSFGIPPDALAADDSCFVAVEVEDMIPVLLVNGSPSDQAFLDELFYVRAALDLGNRAEGDSRSLFRVESVNEAGLEDADLSAFRVVMLANVRRPGPGAAQALARFVESGGGLVVFPGDRTVPGLSSRVLRVSGSQSPLLAAEFESVASPEGGQVRIGKVDYDSGLFAAFRGEAEMDFGAASFARYMEMRPGPGSAVAAEFSNGSPAVATAPRGKGRVVQFASTCDLDWNNLPTRTAFLPLLYETACHAAGLGRGERAPLQVGGRDFPALPEGAGPGDLRVVSPSGAAAPLEARQGSKPSTPPLAEPGFHEIKAASPHVRFVKTLAVNVDPAESVLEAASHADFEAIAGGAAIAVDDPAGIAAEIILHRRGRDLGVLMLVLALMLAVAEVFVANRSLWRAAPAAEAPRHAEKA